MTIKQNNDSRKRKHSDEKQGLIGPIKKRRFTTKQASDHPPTPFPFGQNRSQTDEDSASEKQGSLGTANMILPNFDLAKVTRKRKRPQIEEQGPSNEAKKSKTSRVAEAAETTDSAMRTGIGLGYTLKWLTRNLDWDDVASRVGNDVADNEALEFPEAIVSSLLLWIVKEVGPKILIAALTSAFPEKPMETLSEQGQKSDSEQETTLQGSGDEDMFMGSGDSDLDSEEFVDAPDHI